MPTLAPSKPNIRTGRLPLLDELRGLLILNVVAYHTLYDLVYLFGAGPDWFPGQGAYLWQQWMSGSLIFLAGMACLLTRSNVKRGIKTFGLGLALSLGTWLVMPDQFIAFGILHFMGAAMLLYAALAPLLTKVPTRLGLCLSLGLFIFTKRIYYGFVGLPRLWELPLPEVLYSTGWLFPLGLPGPGFASADYFPLLPWFFLFLAGSFWGRKIPDGKVPDLARQSRLPWLGAIGRHTLAIYLIHQPVIYALLTLIFRIIK